MNRPISFRAWHEGRKKWLHDKSYGGCNILGETIWAFGEWCRVPIEELNDVVVTQFTGIQDSKGVDIYEGDIIRYHEPRRSYQTHYGDNIPGPEGRYTEALEPYIETKTKEVRFDKGAFTFDTEAEIAHNGFVWPFDSHRPAFSDREGLMNAFSCSREQAWIDNGDDETGDCTYLCREYGLATEADLIAHLNTFEVIGNIFQFKSEDPS